MIVTRKNIRFRALRRHLWHIWHWRAGAYWRLQLEPAKYQKILTHAEAAKICAKLGHFASTVVYQNYCIRCGKELSDEI